MPCFARFAYVFRPEKRKHRTSLRQSADVLPAKYGGLCPRYPMFLGLKHGISPIPCPQNTVLTAKYAFPLRFPCGRDISFCYLYVAISHNLDEISLWKGREALSEFLKFFSEDIPFRFVE